ncbi:MAG: hypothetical protein J0H97_22240 [Alphaproteobacteria bacterium]|nr:hypothetical protein [Alphaproteobacteria bacterium]
MQVTQITAVVDDAGDIIEPAGIRLVYIGENGHQIAETRRPVDGANVKRTVLNVTTGTETTEVVPADTLEAV